MPPFIVKKRLKREPYRLTDKNFWCIIPNENNFLGRNDMNERDTLQKFCELVLKTGVNLQKGQGLYVKCPIEKAKVAEELARTAYLMGARNVRVDWENENLERLNYLYAAESALTDVPDWYVKSKNALVEENYCYIAIAAENPSAFAGISTERLSAVATARSKALKKYSDAVMGNAIRWCVASVPTAEWAKQVYPALSESDALDALSAAIARTMRLGGENPVEDWKKHIAALDRRAAYLNEKRFYSLRYSSKNGTDFTVGLADNHKWLSAEEKAKDGVPFVANIPTEEVFTAPHRMRAEGVVKAALPLSYNGNVIDGFGIKFKGGKVVDFFAEKGYDVLKKLIETDAGTRRLGEVALIGKNSPIAKEKTLFFNTLFDENASCHLALGQAYPTTVLGGENLNKKQLASLGLNDSVEHVDFMIGSDDLSVVGVDRNGKETVIFSDGDWVI